MTFKDFAQESSVLSVADYKVKAEHNYKILINDNDPIIDKFTDLSKDYGCKTIVLHDDSFFVEKAGSFLPDLILLNINQLETKGFILLKKLKENPRTVDIPVIILASKLKEEDAIQAFSLGVLDYMVKPAVPALIQRVLNILSVLGKKVMLLDNNELVLELLGNSIKHEGFSVLTCRDGNEALKIARKEQPNIILMETMIPGRDGINILRQFKDDEKTSQIPVIMVSTKYHKNTVMECLESGASDYIQKPFAPGHVISRIKDVLKA